MLRNFGVLGLHSRLCHVREIKKLTKLTLAASGSSRRTPTPPEEKPEFVPPGDEWLIDCKECMIMTHNV